MAYKRKRVSSENDRQRSQKKRISREQRRRKQQQYKIISWILTGIFVIIFYAVICAGIGNRRLFSRTSINGLDVGGMKNDEAARAVDEQFRTKYGKADVAVNLDGETYTVDVSHALNYSSKNEIRDIQDKTHSFWLRGYRFLVSKTTGSEFNIYPKVGDKSAIKDAISSSDMVKVDLSKDDGYVIEDKKLMIIKGQGSYSINRDKLVSLIVKQVEKGDYDTVIECPVESSDVNLDEVYERVHSEPQNPTLDPDNNYDLVEAKDGVDFDLDSAKTSLTEAKDGDRVEIPLTYTPADMTTDEYKSLLFRDELGSYSTEVEGSDNRKTNVKLAAEYCDGTILMPGESFSYNLGVGELTEERGFRPGPSYADGQSVMDMGGGICQVSSTMYMACLYANLEIDERHCHPYPSSYVPAGLDATVAWGGCDFIFTNDTDYPIKLSTTYDGYSTSCTIWGTVTEPFSVELYTETLETEPYETKYELDKSLGKDEQVLDTVGIDGLTIQSYRRVYDGDGNVISDSPEAESVYSRRDEVYKVGKLPGEKKNKKDSTEKSTENEEDSTEKQE
ncbi:MAG: VanW family protein [Clostridiales bacterium]|nr:VanW family protein [Clostridiales bacterium]